MVNKKKLERPKKIEGNKQEQASFSRMVYGLVKFVEIGKSALTKVTRGQRKVNQQNAFRLECNVEFAVNILMEYLDLAPSYLQELADSIIQEENFMKEVDGFADSIAPDKSVLVTKNINKEFKSVTTMNKFAKGIKIKE